MSGAVNKEQLIESGRALGLSNARRIFIYLLPNALAPIAVLGFRLLGDTLREVLDPRLRS